jgi:hypothetical protein
MLSSSESVLSNSEELDIFLARLVCLKGFQSITTSPAYSCSIVRKQFLAKSMEIYYIWLVSSSQL